jgi:alpha-L-rhamnosidase
VTYMLTSACRFLALISIAAAAAPPPRVIPAPTFAEPYKPLSGGDFSGPPIPFHPDPLATYVWGPSVNASLLQIFALLPSSVTLTPETPVTSFSNVASLLDPSPSVAVAGPGGIQLDFGVNNAAWLEFDSPDLTPADAARVQLSISEYNEYELTNLGPKVGFPVAHPRGGGAPTMWRLEIPHSDGSGLFEGVRFAWLRVNATPAAPWTITGLRLVCQVKPQNWSGSFAAAGDEDLSKLWYLGAYTVKVNLLADQFGSILIYRGDRFSWTGDAHIAQATAMAALGNFDFVKQNLRFTQKNCNGIES